MKFLAAAGLAGACLATSPLFAADLFDSAPAPMDAPLTQPESELGSNWYIRGDVGYGVNKEATVVPSAGLFPTVGNAPIGDASNNVQVTRGNSQSNMGPNFGLGVGYRVNDWFRAEATWTYTPGPGLGTQQTVYCPETTAAVNNYNFSTSASGTAVPFGYAYDYTKCDGKLNATQYNNTVMAMGYFDLGHFGMFTPFIGVGGGMNVNTLTGSLTFNQQDTGATYAGVNGISGAAPAIWAVQSGQIDQGGNPIYVALPRPANQSGTTQPIGAANWNRTIDTTKYTIAASAAVGVGIQISQSATLDIGYHVTTLDLFGGTKSLLQSVNLGVRYNLN